MPLKFGKDKKDSRGKEVFKMLSSKLPPPPPPPQPSSYKKTDNTDEHEWKPPAKHPEIRDESEILPPAPLPRRRREPTSHARDYDVHEPGKFPPIFVKLDKYKELITEIQKLKSYALGLRDALDALAEMEAELKAGISVAQRALDSFNTAINMIDSRFLKSQGIEPESLEIPAEMDNYIQNVHRQIEKIRHEIRSLSGE